MFIHLSLMLDENLVSALEELRKDLFAVISNRHMQNEYHPHLTVAGYESSEAHSVFNSAASFSSGQSAVPITIDAVGVFVGTSIYAAPTPSLGLLQLHTDIHRKADPGVPPFPWMAPGNWIPHISLLSPFDVKDSCCVMECLSRKFSKISGFCIGLYVEERQDGVDVGEGSKQRNYFKK